MESNEFEDISMDKSRANSEVVMEPSQPDLEWLEERKESFSMPVVVEKRESRVSSTLFQPSTSPKTFVLTDRIKRAQTLDPHSKPSRQDEPSEEEISDISLAVQIEVVNPHSSATVFKHKIYTVRGSDHLSAFETQRRYKEFLALRKRLLNQWPGCYVPGLPPKKAIGNKHGTFVEKRRKLLDEFMKVTASFQHLFMSEDVQIFIRGPPDYTKIKYEVMNLHAIHQKFQSVFIDYSRMPITPQIVESIATDYNFFLEMTKVLQEIEKYAESSLKAYQLFQETFRRMNTHINEYEKVVDTLYETGTVYQGLDYEYTNPYTIILDWARVELLDLKAIMETISSKDDYSVLRQKLEKRHNKHSNQSESAKAGKKTLSEKLSGRNPEMSLLVLTSKIMNTSKDIGYVDFILHVMVSRLAEHEIPKFKTRKGQTYKNIIENFAKVASGEYSEIINACNKTVEFIN